MLDHKAEILAGYEAERKAKELELMKFLHELGAEKAKKELEAEKQRILQAQKTPVQKFREGMKKALSFMDKHRPRGLK